jgi:hypothetical protein
MLLINAVLERAFQPHSPPEGMSPPTYGAILLNEHIYRIYTLKKSVGQQNGFLECEAHSLVTRKATFYKNVDDSQRA